MIYNFSLVDQVKANEEIEGNKRLTYLIRTVKCSRSKILVIIKVMKIILIITTTIIITIISRAPVTTNTELLVTLFNGQNLLTNSTKSSISGVV